MLGVGTRGRNGTQIRPDSLASVRPSGEGTFVPAGRSVRHGSGSRCAPCVPGQLLILCLM
jgi:hypothetical protein